MSRRRRLLVLAAILGVVALAASYTALRTPPTGPPSMVLILVDTLRADRVGPAASGESLTPNLDDLARGGLRFERAYAPSSWTLPSVTSMLTGQMPSEHGVRSWVHAGVPASSPYLPELLADQGYVTTAVMGNANLGQAGFGRGFDLFVEARTEPKLARSGIPLYPSAEDMTDLAIEVLDQVQESRFFLYVHYMDPHAPYLLPRGADDPFAGSDYQGYVVTHLEQVLPLVGRRYTRVYPYFWSKVRTGVEADRSRVRQLYDEKVRYTVWLAGETGRAIDVNITLEATEEPVTLLGATGKGYGGFCLRVPVVESKTVTKPDGTVVQSTNEERIPWADISAKMSGGEAMSGASIFIDSDNIGFPNGWCLREYGFLGVDWPGLEEYTLQPGEPVEMNYRVWVHRGDVTEGKSAEAYANFAEPVEVTASKPRN